MQRQVNRLIVQDFLNHGRIQSGDPPDHFIAQALLLGIADQGAQGCMAAFLDAFLDAKTLNAGSVAYLFFNSPNTLNAGILIEHFVPAQNWYVFRPALCDDQTVKWIFVMKRQ